MGLFVMNIMVFIKRRTTLHHCFTPLERSMEMRREQKLDEKPFLLQFGALLRMILATDSTFVNRFLKLQSVTCQLAKRPKHSVYRPTNRPWFQREVPHLVQIASGRHCGVSSKLFFLLQRQMSF
jgi:hypothetical protein